MFCPSCGTAVSQELNYCNRCGGNLSLVKVPAKPAKSPVESVGEDIFWTTVIGLGLILGGMITLKALELREVLIIAYTVVSSLAFVGIYALNFWRFVSLQRAAREADALRAGALDTKELDAAPARALHEARPPSVTEETTRAFGPSYAERRPR